MVADFCSGHLRIRFQFSGFTRLDYRHKGYKKWSRFFESFGVNPLFIYVLADVLAILLGVITVTYQGENTSLQQVFYAGVLQPVFGNESGSLAYAILFVLLNWAIGYILYKKKIYIKI